MNIRLTTLAAAILASHTLPGLAQSDPFIEKILNEHYPENTAATAEYRQDLTEKRRREGVDKNIVCHYHETSEEGSSESDRFCMHFHSEKTIEGAQGKRRYLLFTGERVIRTQHFLGGLVSLMIFKADGDGWTLLDKKESHAGHWGSAPSAWQWLEFAPDHWGVKGESEHGHMGYISTDTYLLHDDNDKTYDDDILTSLNNIESLGCEDRDKTCLEGERELTSTFKMRPDLGAQAGAYPFEIRVSGQRGSKKKYDDKPFLFKYDSKTHKYIAPKNYPIAE